MLSIVCEKKMVENVSRFIPGYIWVRGYRLMTDSDIVRQSEGRRDEGLLGWGSRGCGLVGE